MPVTLEVTPLVPRTLRLAPALLLIASLATAPPASSSSSKRPVTGLPTPQLLDRAVARGRLDRSTADLYLAYALADHRRLPARFVGDAPWDGTLPLLRLHQRLGRIDPGPKRMAIRSLVGNDEDPGNCSGSNSMLPNSTSSTFFYVEYDAASIGGGLAISNYTTSLDAAWTSEISTFGWAAPPVAPTPAPGSKYHLRVDNLSPNLYGFVSSSGTHAGLVGNNPNTAWNDVDSFASCMVINEDFTGFPSSPQASLDATTAHEFNHSIQFGYGALTGGNSADDVFVEGGATWMEDEVFDGSNDNYNYLWPDFTDSMGQYPDSPYPYWVVFRALTERYGAGTAAGGEQVMEDFWEAVSQSSTSIDLDALNAGLVNKGTNLADAYHAAAIALKFNVACSGSIAYPYCLEEGPAYVAFPGNGATPVQGSIGSVGGSFLGSVRDNYALSWATLPSSGPYSVTLQNTSTGGELRATVACKTSTGMARSELPIVVGAGGSMTLASFSPSGSGCITAPVAVITNQSQTSPDPSSSTARSYTLSTGTVGVVRSLSVSVGGTGSGTVTGNGIDCGSDCSEPYPDGTLVTLTASASSGSGLTGWSGACSGTAATCAVTMDSDKVVSATFSLTPTPGPKSVTLTAKPKKVPAGGKTRLTATVSACDAGDPVEFYRGAKKIATKPVDSACVARHRVRVRRTVRFQARSPADDDGAEGQSAKVKVRVI